MRAAHDARTLRRLAAPHVMRATHRREQAEQLRLDVREAKKRHGAARAVAVCLMSTEVAATPVEAHRSLAAFEAALDRDDPAITPTQLYAYACLRERVPFANGTPNVALETGALRELA